MRTEFPATGRVNNCTTLHRGQPQCLESIFISNYYYHVVCPEREQFLLFGALTSKMLHLELGFVQC